jgi:hypothetical protein
VSAKTIDEVVVRLQSIEQALARDDGLRWFNRLYRDVTLAVRDYCGSGQLKAGPFLPQLDVYFGNRYFDAFDAAASGAHVPKCWSPLFEARHNRSIAPLQFALAGMNAHISHDLSMGVVDTCEALGIAPSDGSPQHRDYRAVNGILKTTESKTKQWLLTGATRQLDHEVALLMTQSGSGASNEPATPPGLRRNCYGIYAISANSCRPIWQCWMLRSEWKGEHCCCPM